MARKGGGRYVEEVRWAVDGVAEVPVDRLMGDDSKILSLLLLPSRPAAQIMSLFVPVFYFYQ